MADLCVLTSHKLEKKHEATSSKLEAKRCWLPGPRSRAYSGIRDLDGIRFINLHLTATVASLGDQPRIV